MGAYVVFVLNILLSLGRARQVFPGYKAQRPWVLFDYMDAALSAIGSSMGGRWSQPLVSTVRAVWSMR